MYLIRLRVFRRRIQRKISGNTKGGNTKLEEITRGAS
jgi:hypothetical protein